MQYIWQHYCWLLIYLLRLKEFGWRYLSTGEISLAQTVFGDLIDYSQVKIIQQAFVPWQADGIIMAPRGAIHLRPIDYVQDFSAEPVELQAIFIHEMTHIYQFQIKINVLVRGAILQSIYYLSFKRYNPYLYHFNSQKRFLDYNIEQQGEIAKDIFFNKLSNIIKNERIY